MEASLSLYAFAVRRIPVTIETVVSISRFGSGRVSHGPSFFIGLSSAFALFVIKRKEKVFGHFIQFRGRTFLIASFFNHGLRCG